MRVDTRRRHTNAGRPADKSAPGFLAWLRQRNCIFADDHQCDGKVQACHLDFAGDKGMSTKNSDRYSIPMCALGHHARQHTVGWDTFMAEMGVTREMLMIAAARLWNAWPSRPKWERERAA